MHTNLTWARQIRLKGREIDSRAHAPVLVAYIPWAKIQDFVKGEEARIDGPCKFVCQGTPSNKHGKLTFPHWNNYSAIINCVCNKQIEFHYACCNVTTLKHVCGLHVMTLPSTNCCSPQVSLPIWTKWQYLPHTSGYKHMYQKKQKLNSKGKYVPDGKGHLGPHTSARMQRFGQQRGCQCDFVVKQLYLEPSVAKITYHQVQHVNLKGYFYHGATKTSHKRYSEAIYHRMFKNSSWIICNWVCLSRR